MNLYEHIKDKIITALVGRPEGTEIQPEAHQEYALELLNYIKFVEIGSTSSLMGFADQFTIPLQPIGAKITYIGAVGANESKTFSNFIDKDGNPITVVAGNNSLIVTLLWNTQYWEYISVPTSVSVVINNNTGEVTGDLETYLKSTFLRKDIADTALGSITFNKNITVKEISSLYALHVNDIALLKKGFQLINGKGIDEVGNALLGEVEATTNIISPQANLGQITISSSIKSPGVLTAEAFTFLGSGYILTKDVNGNWNMALDNLTVRKSMNVFELTIQEIKSVGGQILLTLANMKSSKILEYPDYWRVYFETDEGAIRNQFEVGDGAICQRFDGRNIKRYWRRVVSKGEDYIDLSKVDCEPGTTGIPEPDDAIIQLGNNSIAARQNAILISSYGVPGLYQYKGISGWSLENKLYTQISPEGNYFKAKSFIIEIDGVETDVKQTLDGHQYTISQHTTEISAIPGLIQTKVAEAVSAIQVGAVNLISNLPGNWVSGRYDTTSGAVVVNNAFIRSVEKYTVKLNFDYTITAQEFIEVVLYDSSDNFVSTFSKDVAVSSLTINTGSASKIGINFRNASTTEITPDFIKQAYVQIEEGNVATAFNYSPSDVQTQILLSKQIAENALSEVTDVESALGDLTNTINTTFKDGVINEAALLAIEERIFTLNNEKNGITAVYNELINNTYLLDKSSLNLDYVTYSNKHADLINAINTAIYDKYVQPNENQLVINAINAYTVALQNLKTRIESSYKAIQDRLKFLFDDGISQTQSQITQTASEIRFEVSQDVTRLDGRINSSNTLIQANTDSILLKAEKTEVDDLGLRMGSAEQKITPDSITSTVRSHTEYIQDLSNKEGAVFKQSTAPSHLNGRLWIDTSKTPNVWYRSDGSVWKKLTPTEAAEVGAYSKTSGESLETRITQTENNITLTAQQLGGGLDAQGKVVITPTQIYSTVSSKVVENVNTGINNLQIGTRNYFKNGKVNNSVTSTLVYYSNWLSENIPAGTKVSISVRVKSSAPTNGFAQYFNEANPYVNFPDQNLTTDWKIFTLTRTLSSDLILFPSNTILHLRWNGTFTVNIDWICVVIGDKAMMSFVAAPEDVQAYTDGLFGPLESRVSYAETAIDQTAEAVTLRATKEEVNVLPYAQRNLAQRKDILAWNNFHTTVDMSEGVDAIEGEYYRYNYAYLNAKNLFPSIVFKENSRYSVSLRAVMESGNAPYITFHYTDGTNDLYVLNYGFSTPTTISYVTRENKTLSKISGTYNTDGYVKLFWINVVEGTRPVLTRNPAVEDAKVYAQAQFLVQADQISSKVSQTEFNNFSIGVKNFWLDSQLIEKVNTTAAWSISSRNLASLVENGTKMTIQFDVVSNADFNLIIYKSPKNQIVWDGTSYTQISSHTVTATKTTIKATFTFDSSKPYIVLYKNSVLLRSTTITNLMLGLGDKVSWAPADEDIVTRTESAINQRAGSIELSVKSIGKRVSNLVELLDRTGELVDKMIDSSGNEVTYANSNLSIVPIDVFPNETLIFRKTTSTLADNSFRCGFYDKDGNFISRFTSSLNETSKVVPDGSATLKVSYSKDCNPSVKSVLGGINDRLSSAELKITDDSIVSTVRGSTLYASDRSADLSTASNTAQSKIDAVVVGGVNYFLNGSLVRTGSTFCEIKTNYLTALIGKQVVISFEIKSSNSATYNVYPYQNNGVSIAGTRNITTTTTYKRVWFVETIKDWGINNVNYTDGGIGFYNANGSGLSIMNVKIEVGNKPTDYTDAPQDIKTDYESKINIQKNRITMTASSVASSFDGSYNESTGAVTITPDKISLAVRTSSDFISTVGVKLDGGSELMSPYPNTFSSVTPSSNNFSYATVKSNLPQGKTLKLIVESSQVLTGSFTDYSIRLYDLTTNTGYGSGIILPVSTNPQEWVFTTPSDGKYYEVLVYAGRAGATANNQIKVNNVSIKEASQKDVTDWNLSLTKSGLLATGINIDAKSITLIAENTTIKSTSGQPIALFTVKNGVPLLKADNIDAENLFVRNLNTSATANRDGARVEVVGASNSLTIYNSLNEAKTILSPDNIPALSTLIDSTGRAYTNVSMIVNRNPTTVGTWTDYSTQTITLSVTAGKKFSVKTPAISGSLGVRSGSGVTRGAGCTIDIYLENQTTGSMWWIWTDSVFSTNTTPEIVNYTVPRKDIIVSASGVYRIKVVSATDGEMGVANIYMSISALVAPNYNLDATPISSFNMIGLDGIALVNSSQDYLYNRTGEFEVRKGSAGIRIYNNVVQKFNGTSWVNVSW